MAAGYFDAFLYRSWKKEKSRSMSDTLYRSDYPCVTFATLMLFLSYDAGRCRRIPCIGPPYGLVLGNIFYVSFGINND